MQIFFKISKSTTKLGDIFYPDKLEKLTQTVANGAQIDNANIFQFNKSNSHRTF